jgi:histidine ammonia-lyase
MGSISAKKLLQVIDNVRSSLAIEVLTASQGIDQRRPLRAARGVAAAHDAVRKVVPELGDDRPLYRDIAAVAELLRSGELVRAVEAAVGPLA